MPPETTETEPYRFDLDDDFPLDAARALVARLFEKFAPALTAADVVEAWNSGAPDFPLMLDCTVGANGDKPAPPAARLQRAESIIARLSCIDPQIDHARWSIPDHRARLARLVDDARACVDAVEPGEQARQFDASAIVAKIDDPEAHGHALALLVNTTCGPNTREYDLWTIAPDAPPLFLRNVHHRYGAALMELTEQAGHDGYLQF